MKLRHWILSLLICFYLGYTFQASFFPGMGLNRFWVWPWTPWRLLAKGTNHNHSMTALGTTRSGKTVVVDLESMFEFLNAGHRPGLLLYLEPLYTPYGANIPIKDRFSEGVVQKYNQKVRDENEKLTALDVYGLSWSKNRYDRKESVVTRLFHRWTS